MDQRKLRDMITAMQREALQHEGQALRLRQALAGLLALQEPVSHSDDNGSTLPPIRPMGEASDI